MAQQLVNIPWATGLGNIRVAWDDADPSPTEVKISSTDVHQEQRSQVLTFKSTDYDAEASLTVNQAATEITYTLTPVLSSVSNIPASGGNVQVERCELQEFHNGDLVETSEVTPDSITGTADGFTVSENTIAAANRGTVEGDVRSIQITCSYLTPRGITAQGTVTISQEANTKIKVYSKPNIVSFTVEDIPASGGSISSGEVSYSQRYHYYYSSGQTEEVAEPITTGGQVTFGDPVTAESLGTTIKDRTIVGQLTCQVAMNGQTSVEGDASVYQAANTAHKSDKTQIAYVEYVEDGGERSGDLPVDPSGQLLLPANFRFIYFYIDLWVKFDSGFEDRWWLGSSIPEEVRIEIQNIFKWGPAPSFVLNGEVYPLDETASDTIDGVEYFYAAYVGDFNNTSDKLLRGEFLIEDVGETMPQNTTLFLTQSAGAKTYSEITVNLSYPQASAAGGTVNPILTYSQTWGWNGSTTGGGTITSGASVSYSGTNINTSTGAATVASKGTTVSGVTTATTASVTVSMNGKTAQKSVAVQQAANAITSSEYQDAVITVSPDVKQVAATGETFSISYTATEAVVNTYTSGDTDSTTSPLSGVLYDNSADWVNVVDNGDNTYNITVDANTSTSSRSASVMVYSNSGHTGVRASDALSIQQAGTEETLEVSAESIEFEAEGGTKELNIDSNTSWNIS